MKKFINTLKNIWSIEELRSKILVTVMLIAIYRLGTHIVLPGLDPARIDPSAATGGILGLIDAFAGGLPHAGQPTRSEYFIKGTEPTAESPIYKNKDGKDYIVLQETDPTSTDGQNLWQKGIDEWIEQNYKDDEKYHPPSELKEKMVNLRQILQRLIHREKYNLIRNDVLF